MKKVIFYFTLLLLLSCNSIEKSNLDKNINPNACRINGTILSIEKSFESSGPCVNHLCTASVLVNTIVSSGFSFNHPFAKSDTIKIKFEFTLDETTKDMFPNLTKSFPGLKVGDSFIGDVESIETIKFNKKETDSFSYKIFNYDKIK